MPRNKLSVGDLVTHKDGGGAIFVIQGSLEPVDPKDPGLYQCSHTRTYDFDWHNYLGTDLSRAEGVPEEQKPDAIKLLRKTRNTT